MYYQAYSDIFIQIKIHKNMTYIHLIQNYNQLQPL